MDGQNPMSQVIAHMTSFSDGLEGIRKALERGE